MPEQSSSAIPLLRKATAFVIRQKYAQRELLAFTHPTAGIQVPAGTVEEGEAFEDAALREVHEETGCRFQ
jgi:8-oxo-dGTP pyrophosphatase MutT (NUDIX family)